MAFLKYIKKSKLLYLCEKYKDPDTEVWRARVVKSLGRISKANAKRILYTYETNKTLNCFNINSQQVKLFDTAITEYIEDCYLQRFSIRHVENKKIYLTYVLRFVGNIPVKDVTQQNVEDFRRTFFKNRNVKSVTINNAMRFVKSFFNWCINKNYIIQNPTNKMKEIKTIETKLEIPTEEQIKELLDKANPHLYHILIFLLYTGCRRGEVLNLKLDNIDLDKNSITIAYNEDTEWKPKSKKVRKIPIHPDLLPKLKYLKEYWIDARTNDAYERTAKQIYPFCTKEGQPFQDIRTSWTKLKRSIGLPRLRLHDIRHYHATTLLRHTKDIFVVQKILGHHSIKMTERYLHLVDDHLQTEFMKFPSITGGTNENKVE